jgi:hypothetical protein
MSSQFFPTIPVYGNVNTPQGAVYGVVGERDAVLSGQLFSYSSATTGVLAKAADTSPVMMLWNPSGSGVNLRIQSVAIGAVSGTVILSSLGWGVILNAGSQFGTAAPIVSYTAVAAVNRLVGANGKASQINFAPATVSVTNAPTFKESWGLSAGGAFAAGPLFSFTVPVNGSIVIAPGVAFFPFLSNGAMALTAIVTVVATEEPVLAGVNF